MSNPRFVFVCVLCLFLISCDHKQGYTYTIRDFRKSLQPHLTNIVSKGLVREYDSAMREMATDRELVQLTHAEHPVLRASAFNEIFERKSFSHFKMLMNHLDDTALIMIDAGEFGIRFSTVSDNILVSARWETEEEKSKTVDLVLTRHNYLRGAYTAIPQTAPQEKYYSIIKEMATRSRHLDEEGYELKFDDIEHALYGLAKYKRKNDIDVIKKILMQYYPELRYNSFQLMAEFPDTAYLSVLQKYHSWSFYRTYALCNYPSQAKYFIKALAAQQNEKAAMIFDTILQRLPALDCFPDKEYIQELVVSEIWEHPHPAYSKLREKVRARAEKIISFQQTINLPLTKYPSERIIRWWN